MFKGAKVTRGPDWKWKEQDNQSPTEGEVTEVTSWSDETNNDAVRVNWNKGPRGDIYRLGKNGKVTWANELLLYYYYYYYYCSIIVIIIIINTIIIGFITVIIINSRSSSNGSSRSEINCF